MLREGRESRQGSMKKRGHHIPRADAFRSPGTEVLCRRDEASYLIIVSDRIQYLKGLNPDTPLRVSRCKEAPRTLPRA